MTVFVDKVMMILENELEEGYLTKQEYDDYMNLFRRAAEKIFEKHADLADKNTLLADKDAELDRMRALLEQYHIPVTA